MHSSKGKRNLGVGEVVEVGEDIVSRSVLGGTDVVKSVDPNWRGWAWWWMWGALETGMVGWGEWTMASARVRGG